MGWVKIDDGFADHPKIARVGAVGAWLQLQALCYCNRNLTDGFVPWGVARSFVARGQEYTDEADRCWSLAMTCGMQGRDLDEIDWPAVLVAAGMWEIVPGGYQIHDYKDYQPSKVQVLAERRKHAERQQRYVQRKADHDTDGVTDTAPVPVPVPGSKKKKLAIARKEKAREIEFQELDYDLELARKHGCTAAEKSLAAFRAHALAHKRKLANWKGGWLQWCLHHDGRCPCRVQQTKNVGARVQPTVEQTRALLARL